MGKYLDFYKKCMENGERLPFHKNPSGWYVPNGLCNDPFVGRGVKEWFAPDAPLYSNGGWWGTEIESGNPGVRYGFCPLRQNMVLILAAIYGEFDDENFDDL